MSFDDTINAYFVTTGSGGGSTSELRRSSAEDFASAYTYLRNHVSEENIRQIKASEGFPLIASGRLTKKDVFIFDAFEGDFFAQLQLTKSLIVGPRCLIDCLIKCQPIPLGSSPIYTTAMRELRISATGIPAAEKERLRQLIQWMGGHYFQNFGRTITHLISNTIKSTKYEHATLNGIHVMHVDWVQRVWERSCAENVEASDEEFDKYRLPIFFGTNITCTGLDSGKKNEMMRLINENGGTYHRAFRSQLIDIVITEKSKTNSEKFAAAVRCKKDVLLPEWISDSVEKGFALPTKAYQVKSLKVSTPTKTDQSIADFTATDRSQLSDISCISLAAGGSRKRRNDMMTTVNDTICSSLNDTQQECFAVPAAPVASTAAANDLQRELLKKSVCSGSGVHYRQVYDEICPKQAKKAGAFLDGCCIYLSGFRTQEREKLNRILNVGGATRYDVVNEKITHIIVGQLDDAEFKAWKRDGLITAAVNIVRLDWLLESIKLKQTAREKVYRMSLPSTSEPDAPSPSSKRTLRSMNHSFNFKQPDLPIKKKLFDEGNNTGGGGASARPNKPLAPMATSTEQPYEEEDENNLIAQYSQENETTAGVPLPQPPTAAAAAKTATHNDTTIGAAQPMASSTQLPEQPTTKTAVHNAASAPPISQNPSNLTEGSTACTIDYENLDFFRGMSLYIDREHFPDDFYTQMISECESAQGNVVPDTFRDPVDYAIVSFERTFDETRLAVKARHIVTELYVEQCLKQNKLVPIEYYHKHVPHSADALPLQNMTVVVSVYTGLERDFIDTLTQLLGAKTNKNFVKKEKPLLICPQPEGSKYEGAIKWRYPIVTSEWLVQCAQHGTKLPYRSFLVGDSPEDFAISPTTRAYNSATARSNVSSSTLRAAEEAAPPPVPMETDATENECLAPQETDFTPLRNKRVTELAGPSNNRTSRSSIGGNTTVTPPDSPHTPPNAGRHSVNFAFLEALMDEITGSEAERECMRDVIDMMRNNPTPELERLRRQACTPIKVPTPKGIPDFCTTPAFQKRMADEFERRFRLPTKHIKPDTPIDVLRRRIMAATCKSMGIPFKADDEASFEAMANNTKTSSVDKNATNMSATRARTSLSATTPLQHKTVKDAVGAAILPRSLFAQAETPKTFKTPNGSKTPNLSKTPNISKTHNTTGTPNTSDTFVPCTQTPVGAALENNAAASLVERSTINFDKISFEETEVGSHIGGRRSSHANTSLTATAVAVASPEVKQITEYLRNCESRRQSMKRNEPSAAAAQIAAIELMNTENAHYVQPFESEQFGAGTEDVGWRDPVEFDMARRSKVVATMQHCGTPRFSISCTDEELREDVITKILQLGGEVSENLINFDPECTHFICERPNRGEKILGCISSGKWVLCIKYIEECFAKDVFIDEELYEWGNGRAVNLPELSNEEQVIALAAHRWRRQLNADPNADAGAFSGFRAILRIAERSLDALKNVIKAGKGEIIEAESPFSSAANGGAAQLATHCFVDVKKKPLTPADNAFLRQHGVQVLTQMYINAYLMNGKDVDTAKYDVKV